MTTRPAADPELFGAALPQTSKPYAGDPATMDGIIAGVAIAAHKFAVDSRAGVDPGETLPVLTKAVDGARDAIIGNSDAYEVMPWQKAGGLARYLNRKYAMDGADDPVGTILTKLAHDIVKLYREWELGHIDDTQAELGVGALKTEAARDMLGLPSEQVD